jgi:hypothetical protein
MNDGCRRADLARTFAIVFGIVAILFTAASSGLAQITAATIPGTVKDQTNAVLPGVDVVVGAVDTGVTRTTVTDANGHFTVCSSARRSDSAATISVRSRTRSARRWTICRRS